MSRRRVILCASVLLIGAIPLQASAQTASPEVCLDLPGLSVDRRANAGSVPVVMIHGWAGSAKMWSDPIDNAINSQITPPGRSFAEQVEWLPGAVVWRFEYEDESGRWVTDDRIGGALAEATRCLTDAYGTAPVLVGHSMGGLAIRQALGPGSDGSALGVVTFGTPHAGSGLARFAAGLIDAPPVPVGTDFGTVFVWLLWTRIDEFFDACGAATTIDINACGSLRPVTAFNSAAGIALRQDSSELDVLPVYNAGLPALSLAGEIEVVLQAAATVEGGQVEIGLFYQDIADFRIGDMIVSADSATRHGTESKTGLCRYNWDGDLAKSLVSLDLRRSLGFSVDKPEERNISLVEMGALLSDPCSHIAMHRGAELTTDALGFISDLIGTNSGGSTSGDPLPTLSSSTVLVLDVSDSMNEDTPAGQYPGPKIAAARLAAGDLLEVISLDGGTGSAHEVAVVTFSNDSAVTARSTTNLSSLSETLRMVTASGGTNLGAGLDQGIGLVADRDLRRVVLLSDGDITRGISNAEVLSSVVPLAQQRNVTIDVISFAAPGSVNDFLRSIATATGGSFNLADSALDLRRSFIRTRHDATGAIVVDTTGRLTPGTSSPLSVVEVPSDASELIISLGHESLDSLELQVVDPLGRIVPGSELNIVGSNPVTVSIPQPIPGTWQVYVVEPGDTVEKEDGPVWQPPIDGSQAGAATLFQTSGAGGDVPYVLVASVRTAPGERQMDEVVFPPATRTPLAAVTASGVSVLMSVWIFGVLAFRRRAAWLWSGLTAVLLGGAAATATAVGLGVVGG